MKMTIVSALTILAAIFLAGCQEEPMQPVQSAESAEVAAIRMIEAEINDVSHEGGKGNRNFIGVLSGREEVPATDSRGRGVAKFQLSKDGDAISYKLIVANISNVTGAHIHRGGKGQNGPVVFGLYSASPAGGRINGPIARGAFTPADLVGPYAGSADFAMFLSDLHSDSLYVNVHTSDGVDSTSGSRGDYPAGEIRGQLKGHRPKGDHDGEDEGEGRERKAEGRHDDHGRGGRGR